ncbi:MAG: hypothetical protein ABSC26_04535 [Stellaceae bacterium]|jgi:hypothetical protein
MSNTSKEILITMLMKKRAELAGQLERQQADMAKTIADLGTVDSALFMFAPEIKVEKIAPKQLPPMHPAGRGEMTHLALSILREAREPISTQDLNRMVMEARNLNTNDKKLTSVMRERLHSILRNHRAHKRVRSIKDAARKCSMWEIVR